MTFQNTHAAMKAHKQAKKQFLQSQLIPLPREISNDCGLVLLVKESDADKIRLFFQKNAIMFEDLYMKVRNDKGDYKYEKESGCS